MPSEERGGKVEGGDEGERCRRKSEEQSFQEEKHAERMKRERGQKRETEDETKAYMQTLERGESREREKGSLQDDKWKGGGIWEDRCQDEEEETGREGQREDNRVFGAGMRQ